MKTTAAAEDNGVPKTTAEAEDNGVPKTTAAAEDNADSRRERASSRGKAFMAMPGVAVFEPHRYDPGSHSPSPIFIVDLEDTGRVPEDWKLLPTFSSCLGKSSATIHVGDADLYGGGEVSGDLRRNDDRQFFWNTENPTGFLDNGKRLYQSHPWLLGIRKDGSAFGIIADTTWKSELSTKGKVRFKSSGPSFRIIIIEKDDPAQVLSTLAELTGKMELPPLWSLGYHQCRFSYFPQEKAARTADALREHRIPCDVIWLDIHYMDHYKIFTFNPEGFADPEGLNRYLHSRNFRTVYMIDPGVKAEEGYSVDEQGREGGFFVSDRKGRLYHGKVWPGECHFPDFSRPDVRQWWAGLYDDFLAKGIDGVWNDMNEPSVFVSFGGTMPVSNVHKGGGGLPEGPHLRYHNIYGQLMVRASREGIKAARPDRRPFVLSRSNFLGGQRYAAMWTGDNFSDYGPMKESVPMCLNIGLSGQPFNGPDIGGFLRDCTPDLLKHWTASGVYFPFVRNHSSEGTVDQEPWAFDKETEDVCRTAIERRYRLLPYYYTLFEEASRNGMPVMRPLFWADFKDTSLRAEQQAFLVGSDLLVVPRWSEKPALPDGDWELFSFEDQDDGFQSYLALRPGAAVPVVDVFQSTAEYSTENLTVLVNPDGEGEACGTMYEDAGDGYSYRQGEYARYSLNAKAGEKSVTLEVSRTEGNMESRRRIRVGLVRTGRIFFSEWSGSGRVTMDIPEEAGVHVPAGKADLSFVCLKNGSISRRYTKKELILTNIVK